MKAKAMPMKVKKTPYGWQTHDLARYLANLIVLHTLPLEPKGNRGEDHSRSQLAAEDVKTIRAVYGTGEISLEKLGKAYRLTKQAIHHVIKGKTWTHITGTAGVIPLPLGYEKNLKAGLAAATETPGPLRTPCLIWQGKTMPHASYGTVHNSKGVGALVHRLVFARAYGFLPPVVRHLCDNGLCVRVEHLQAGCQRTNVRDKYRRNRDNHCHGAAHHMSRLTDNEILAIRAKLAAGAVGATLAKEYGVAASLISRIRNGIKVPSNEYVKVSLRSRDHGGR